MRFILLVTFLLILVITVAAQNSPTPVKTFALEPGYTNDQFIAAVKGFLTKLKVEPKSTTGIITIEEDVSERFQIATALLKKSSSLKRRLVITNPICTYRPQFTATEFWLVPKGSAQPYEPFTCDVACPDIGIIGPTSIGSRSESITYTANISGASSDATITYDWRVTNGKITSGQGTPSIIVRPVANSRPIIANLKIGGIPREYNCSITASVSTPRQ
jgi:hypothetical protein